MATDLDTRITRALGARADGITVTRPALDDVLAGAGAAPAPGGGRRRTPLLAAAALVVVLAVAAVALATRTTDDGVVDVSPAQQPTTTTTVPLGLAYLPPGIGPDPTEATSPDGATTVLTYGSGDRAVEVTVAEATRSPELDAALDARDTRAIVEAYAAGGSVVVAGPPPPTPLADDVLGPPAGLAVRLDDVIAHAQSGDDPLLVVAVDPPVHSERIDVGVVAFRAGAEVRIAGRGLRTDEVLAVLAGVRGPGLEPRRRPAEESLTEAAPWPGGTSFVRTAVTDLPEGWVRASAWPTEVSTTGYGPVGQEPMDADDLFAPAPNLTVTLARSTPLPQQQDVLDHGDDAALVELFDAHDLGIWASGGHSRVLHLDDARLLIATGVVDGTTVADLDTTHEITWIDGWLGPDLRIEVQAQGLTEDQLVAAIRSVVLIR